jgi:hypothetical protein
MHAPPDRSPKDSHRTEPKSGGLESGSLGFFILPAIVLFVLVTLAIAYPKSSIWISQAVDAEFGGGGFAADPPVETVQPGMAIPMRTVDVY